MSEISHAGWCSRKRCIGECWGRGSPEHASVLEETIAELEASLATAQARVRAGEKLAQVLNHAIEMGQYTPGGSTEKWAIDTLNEWEEALSQPPTAEKEE